MLPEVGTTSVDLTSLADATREDANLAIQTLAAIARRQILESHRLTRVKFTLPINPALDTSRAITVDRPDLLASGKIARLTETYDLTAGSALAAVELAISGLIGVGTVDSDPLKSPELEALPSQSQADSADLGTCLEGRSQYSTSTTGYTTGASGDAASEYPHEVAIAVPEIPVYLTDPVSRELAYTVSVAIPVDHLEFRS
ncbi:hypothetical protein [Paludibacterium denitrificans]|uniref:hypothetical protein n=1 Tax=Paludibacterium denitrificans TaxID=2675226 RepID=UPI001E37B144|nr:hypothetical protein [Paludibacterium denitrificans]